VASLILVLAFPALVLAALVVVPMGAIVIRGAQPGTRRDLANSLAQVAQALVLVPVTACVSGAFDPVVVLAYTLVAAGYQVGTVLVVRSVLRERGNEAFAAFSAGFHVALVILAGVALPPAYAVVALGLAARAIALPIVGRRLSTGRHPMRPIHVGIVEMVASLAVVIVSFAVPIWAGTRPYQQLPFQWSLHIEKSARGQPEHAECLDLSGAAPMRHVAERLVEAVGPTGLVLMYTSFERQCLATLATCCPDLAARLEAISGRLVDLHPIIKRNYCHPDMHGSWSIKAVLPAIAPDMDYALLDEIQDGGAAQRAYLEAIHPATPATRRAGIRERLLRYCAHDTLAMVRLARWCQGTSR
jgi:hypothetical protein